MLSVDPTDPTPLYAQLDRSIRAAIAAGRLNVGDRLPTVRQLAVDLRVNANTVAKVYAELERAFVRDMPHTSAQTTRRDRERELRQLVDRLLADASAVGITLPEVVQYIEALGSRQTKEKP